MAAFSFLSGHETLKNVTLDDPLRLLSTQVPRPGGTHLQVDLLSFGVGASGREMGDRPELETELDVWALHETKRRMHVKVYKYRKDEKIKLLIDEESPATITSDAMNIGHIGTVRKTGAETAVMEFGQDLKLIYKYPRIVEVIVKPAIVSGGLCTERD